MQSCRPAEMNHWKIAARSLVSNHSVQWTEVWHVSIATLSISST